MASKGSNEQRTVGTTRRLGRGLSSLIGAPVELEAPAEPGRNALSENVGGLGKALGGSGAEVEAAGPRVERLPVGMLVASPYQPRRVFAEEGLRSLAESIKTAGVMQPVLVRRRGADDSGAAAGTYAGAGTQVGDVSGVGYELVAGERRWRAAKLAGLDRVPAVVVELSDQEAAEWALIENVQREDLGVMERAGAYANLISRFGLTHAQVAERVGVDRVTVSQTVRLLELDAAARAALESGELSFGVGRALLGLGACRARQEIGELAREERWTVVMVNEAVRLVLAQGSMERGWTGWPAGSEYARVRVGGARGGAAAAAVGGSAMPGGIDRGEGAVLEAETRLALEARARHVADVERRLSEALGTKVQVRVSQTRAQRSARGGRGGGGQRGKVIVEWYSLDQLDGLMERMGAGE